MAGENLILVVGSYPDAGGAAEDFKALKDGEERRRLQGRWRRRDES